MYRKKIHIINAFIYVTRIERVHAIYDIKVKAYQYNWNHSLIHFYYTGTYVHRIELVKVI